MLLSEQTNRKTCAYTYTAMPWNRDLSPSFPTRSFLPGFWIRALYFGSKVFQHLPLFVVPRFYRFSETYIFSHNLLKQNDILIFHVADEKSITNLVTKQVIFKLAKRREAHEITANKSLLPLRRIGDEVYRQMFPPWTKCYDWLNRIIKDSARWQRFMATCHQRLLPCLSHNVHSLLRRGSWGNAGYSGGGGVGGVGHE